MSRNPKKLQRGTLRKILIRLRPHLPLLLLSVILSAASVALTLYVPVLIGRAIDCIVGPGQVDFAAIGRLLAEILLLVAVTALLQWVVSTIHNRITFQVVQEIRIRCFRQIQKLPLRYLDSKPVGEIVSRVVADADQFADGLLLGFTQLFAGVVTILGTLGFMVSIQPVIAGVVVLLTPVSFLVARFIAGHTHRYFQEQSQLRAEQTAFINERLESQKVVKAFGQEENSRQAFDEINLRMERCALKAVFFSSLTNPCTRFVNSLVYAGVVMTGALLCVSTAGTAAAFSVGSLSALLAYANQYTKPFNEISGVLTELQNALVCASRIFELTEAPAEAPETPETLRLQNVRGSVDLEDVSFSYRPEQRLIEHLNLRVKRGQRVAIVGPTGCGKTTLINLLMRFYDVDQGRICVDGADIRNVTRSSLRENYGMVLQETWLCSGTIRENLKLGKPEATDAEMEAACRAAHAHGFISRLSRGYDTEIPEDGGQLSQGQKQLLCIARVMLCLPPMLILDEATSSIDTRTELKVQNAFAAMMRGRTSFIVAHRLSTIREADVILVMREGKVVEIGNHETLLKAGGFYADLYNSQFSE